MSNRNSLITRLHFAATTAPLMSRGASHDLTWVWLKLTSSVKLHAWPMTSFLVRVCYILKWVKFYHFAPKHSFIRQRVGWIQEGKISSQTFLSVFHFPSPPESSPAGAFSPRCSVDFKHKNPKCCVTHSVHTFLHLFETSHIFKDLKQAWLTLIRHRNRLADRQWLSPRGLLTLNKATMIDFAWLCILLRRHEVT